MQFTTTLIASILAVAAVAAPNAAAAADVEKRQLGCLTDCVPVDLKLGCILGAGSVNEAVGCLDGNRALVRCNHSLLLVFMEAYSSLSRSAAV